MKKSGLVDRLGRRHTVLGAVCLIVSLVVGCELPGVIYSSIRYPVGLEFIDAETGRSTFVPSGSMREHAVGVGAAGGCFTLERNGRQLQARVRTTDGRVLSSREIPLLTEGYAGPGVVVSRDLNTVAYRDYARHAIRRYELDSGRNQDVLGDQVGLGFMHFIGNDELLVVADEGTNRETRTARLLVVNTATRESRTIAPLNGPSVAHQFHVSSNDRYLAVARVQFSRTAPSRVRVFDLRDGRETAAVNDLAPGYVGCVAVRDDGQAIAWYRHGRDTHTLMAATLAGGGTPRELRSYPDQTALWLDFAGAESLVFARWLERNREPTKLLVTVDMNTGEERIVAKKAINGAVLVMDAPLTFVCPTGY